jgi:Sulfotransferase family
MSAPKRVFFFCHLPKAAGSSVVKRITELVGAKQTWADESARPITWLNNLSTLSNMRLVTGHVPAGIGDHLAIDGVPTNSYTVLRDPVERVLSHFHFLSERGDIPHIHSIEEFLEHDDTRGVEPGLESFAQSASCEHLEAARGADSAAVIMEADLRAKRA